MLILSFRIVELATVHILKANLLLLLVICKIRKMARTTIFTFLFMGQFLLFFAQLTGKPILLLFPHIDISVIEFTVKIIIE